MDDKWGEKVDLTYRKKKQKHSNIRPRDTRYELTDSSLQERFVAEVGNLLRHAHGFVRILQSKLHKKGNDKRNIDFRRLKNKWPF